MEDYNEYYKYTFRYNRKHTSDACKHSKVKKHEAILKYKSLTLSGSNGITYWRMSHSPRAYFSIDSISQAFVGGINFM